MIKTVKRLALAGVVTAAAAAGAAVVAPAPAQAAAYNGACGAGYSVIDGMSLVGKGTVYLTYSRGTGKNCVVTIADNPGRRRHMAAKVSLAGDPWKVDSGNFTTYAGPVYVTARDRCIDWGGEIENLGRYQYNVHCG
jgi:hypothetical protein